MLPTNRYTEINLDIFSIPTCILHRMRCKAEGSLKYADRRVALLFTFKKMAILVVGDQTQDTRQVALRRERIED